MKSDIDTTLDSIVIQNPLETSCASLESYVDNNFDKKITKKIKKDLRDSNKSRVLFAMILASNSVGISSLAYPSSVASTGVVLFIILMILAIFINFLTGYLLVYCAKIKKARNYSHLTEIMLGKYKFFVDFSFFITNLGIILSCILTFNDFMCGIFNHKFFGEKNHIMTNKKSLFWIILPNILLLPVLLRKNYRDISVFSTISVLAIVLLSFFSIYIFSERVSDIDFHKVTYFSYQEGPKIFSLLLFGFMNQQNLIDIFGELKRKRLRTFNHILKIQYSVLAFIYLSIALFGYLSFYNYDDIKTKNIFAFDLEKNSLFIFINFCVAFSVLLSMIVTFKPTKDLLTTYFITQDPEEKMKINIFCTIFLQITLILTAALLVVYELNFLDVINFTAVLLAPLISIYLPVYYYVQITKKYYLWAIIVIVFLINMYVLSQF